MAGASAIDQSEAASESAIDFAQIPTRSRAVNPSIRRDVRAVANRRHSANLAGRTPRWIRQSPTLAWQYTRDCADVRGTRFGPGRRPSRQ